MLWALCRSIEGAFMSCTLARNSSRLSLYLVLTALLLGVSASPMLPAQTVALSDSTVVQASPYRIGINIGAVNFYDTGQIYKNLFGATNVGFEPLTIRSIWVANAAG